MRPARPPAVVPVPASPEAPAFFLGRTAVVNAEYAPVVEDGVVPAPPWWNDPRFASADQPVVGVSWDDAAAFCEWLGRVHGGRWRLPTEREWERAANGGRVSPRTAWGDEIPDGEIPDGPISGPWAAGRGQPNPYGLYDMGTAIHEWCLDRRGPDRRGSRGGSWRHAVRWSAPGASSSLPPSYRYSDYGFRVLRELESGG